MIRPRVSRVELGVDQRGRRPVAGEDLVRRQRRIVHRRLGLLERAAAHQRLGLREAVGEQDLVLVVERRLVADGRDQELAGDDVGALVDQLVEGVLAVGAGLAQDHRPGRGRDRRAVEGHALAVRLHVELLQVGRQPQQPLVVGQDRAGRIAHDIAVPDADEPEQHRHVLRQRRVEEMLVHLVRAGQELGEALRADGDHHRQADRAPDRVAAADPVPEAEDPARGRCRTPRSCRARSRPRRSGCRRTRPRRPASRPAPRGRWSWSRWW